MIIEQSLVQEQLLVPVCLQIWNVMLAGACVVAHDATTLLLAPLVIVVRSARTEEITTSLASVSFISFGSRRRREITRLSLEVH